MTIGEKFTFGRSVAPMAEPSSSNALASPSKFPAFLVALFDIKLMLVKTFPYLPTLPSEISDEPPGIGIMPIITAVK